MRQESVCPMQFLYDASSIIPASHRVYKDRQQMFTHTSTCWNTTGTTGGQEKAEQDGTWSSG